MTTLQDYVKTYCTERGMFEDQAIAVTKLVMEAEENESMKNRWNDHAEGYPDVLLKVLAFSVRNHALAWIDENLPLAWYRDMFSN